MNQINDTLISKKFGHWTITSIGEKDKFGAKQCFVVCCCGVGKLVRVASLKSGNSKSCGCKSKTYNGPANRTSPIYTIWTSMRQRCNDSGHIHYASYGGRGIKVCKRWDSFENFAIDMGEKPAGKTLDRIDNDGEYCPENCTWSTQKEQCRNTRRNRLITFGGKTHCITEWAEITGIERSTIKFRLNSGWSIDRALTEKTRGSKNHTTISSSSTVISILRRKRDRYKSSGKADKANTVESCIQTLKEWAK